MLIFIMRWITVTGITGMTDSSIMYSISTLKRAILLILWKVNPITLLSHRLAEVKMMYGDRMDVRSDRKSTRLNSSHVASSYAVFCLKEKTTLDPPFGATQKAR